MTNKKFPFTKRNQPNPSFKGIPSFFFLPSPKLSSPQFYSSISFTISLNPNPNRTRTRKMADRVYPTAKPNPPPAALNGGSTIPNGSAGPAKTGQLYNPNRPRPVYRPQQNRRSNRSCSCRKCCCLTFIYTLIAILSLLLLAAIAGCIFYVLYHPKHP